MISKLTELIKSNKITSIIVLIGLIVMFSGLFQDEKDTNDKKVNDVRIEGTYSGENNIGTKSEITLYSSGGLFVTTYLGYNTKRVSGHWEGSADNISLYLEDTYGEVLMGTGSIRSSGLRIDGGEFYNRD